MGSYSRIEIVQQKFRQSEKVLAVFESYQIVSNEHANRILALVYSTGTYAVFSLKVARLPPETISDLTIDTIFKIDEHFSFITGKKTSFLLQFDLKTPDEALSTFYYYPMHTDGVNDFDTFYTKVLAAQNSYISIQSNMKKQSTNEEDVIPLSSMQTDVTFHWLNSYKNQADDFTAIDRNIAEGSKQLKNGESKFQDELKKREHEYITYKNIRIYCATWNINGQSYRECPLSLWLAASEYPPDIYAVGLQELDLSPKAVTFSESRPDPIWNRRIMENLHLGACYEELTSVRLVGMMLTIIVTKELRPNIIRYKVQTVGTGALNFMGNKGGVAVSLTLNDANICFVNSHLAAHINEVESRNQDFVEINKRCVFEELYEKRTIDQHDHIFWIGDLNYRIEEPPGQCIDFTNFEQLLNFDQLRSEMIRGKVFQGYVEGSVKFRPTYKYDIGTDNYDTSEKCRIPAYCDRVLWKGERISQIVYNSVMELRQSDHKPVYAEFLTGIKTKDQQLYKMVHEDVLKRVDKYENDNQPQITVEKTDIDLGIITFNELSVKDFTVANNCHLPVEFTFKSKNESNTHICEKWLDVEPKYGSLITGSSLSIRIKFFACSKIIASLLKTLCLSEGKVVLDILVLHVKNGRDIFITILGEYRCSCFGISLENLCRTGRPISDYTLKELHELDKTQGDKFNISVPREIFLLVDRLHKLDDKAEGVFTIERKYSKSVHINQIRDWLDTWSRETYPGDLYTTAEAILMLLEAQNEPLLKPYEEALLNTNTLEEAMSFVAQLSLPRQNIFYFLCMFLREGIEKKCYNINNLATLFGNIFFKKRTTHVEDLRDGRCRLLMFRFLQSDLNSFLEASALKEFDR